MTEAASAWNSSQDQCAGVADVLGWTPENGYSILICIVEFGSQSFPVLVTIQVTGGKATFAGDLVSVLFSENE